MQGMIGENICYLICFVHRPTCTCTRVCGRTVKYFYHLFFNRSVSGKTEEGETEESLHVSKLNCETSVV